MGAKRPGDLSFLTPTPLKTAHFGPSEGDYFWETAPSERLAPLGAGSLTCALENLKQHFSAVMLAEKMHEVNAVALYRYLGLPVGTGWARMSSFLTEPHSTLRTSPNQVNSTEVPLEMEREIVRLNEMDLQLYEHATQMHAALVGKLQHSKFSRAMGPRLRARRHQKCNPTDTPDGPRCE